MNIKEFEELILSEIESTTAKIIKKHPTLNISARSRAGAEISNFLENKFVSESKNHKYFINSEASPEGATKNPWDVRTFFKINKHQEEIWIDFKAIKISGLDSNPDIGSPGKVIKFIENKRFYLAYVYVYYQEKGEGLEFTKVSGKFVKAYFLKDINKTFRRNPKNQLQVNLSAPIEYRTRAEFIKLLMKKLKESHLRQIKISEKALQEIDQKEKELLKINKISESDLTKNF